VKPLCRDRRIKILWDRFQEHCGAIPGLKLEHFRVNRGSAPLIRYYTPHHSQRMCLPLIHTPVSLIKMPVTDSKPFIHGDPSSIFLLLLTLGLSGCTSDKSQNTDDESNAEQETDPDTGGDAGDCPTDPSRLEQSTAATIHFVDMNAAACTHTVGRLER